MVDLVHRCRIDEANIGRDVVGKGFSDHAFKSLLRKRPTRIIDGKFDEDQVRFVAEYVSLKPGDAQIGIGAGDRGIDLSEVYFRIGLPEIIERLGPPSRLGGDAAADERDRDFFSTGYLAEKVRPTATCV